MTNRNDIPALTGLRFFAALFVCLAHAVPLLLPVAGNMPAWQIAATRLSAEGMTLFFVLSGFVIHYNYSASILSSPSAGIYSFAVARFARLYPLYFACLAADLLRLTLSSQLHAGFLHAIPYYLTLTMSWLYLPIDGRALIYQFGQMPSVSWSISTEWFFYFTYPVICFGLAKMSQNSLGAVDISEHTVIPAKAGTQCFSRLFQKHWVPAFADMRMAFTLKYQQPSSIKRLLIIATMLCVSMIALIAYISTHSSALNDFAAAFFNPIMESRQHNDSFSRWLIYFSPYSRISEFILGCLIAAVYLHQQKRPPSIREQRLGLFMLLSAIVSIVVLQYAIFNPPNTAWLVWVPSLHQCFGFAPSVAVIIYCCARYQNSLTRGFSHPLILLGGEISYSFYLLHSPIITLFARHADKITSLQTALFDGAILIAALVTIFSAAFLSYRTLEVPAKRWVRNILMRQSAITA